MADLFAAFLHALPALLGFVILAVALYGFWRGLGLKPKPMHERMPDPMSPAEAVAQYYDTPPRWPKWILRLFGRV